MRTLKFRYWNTITKEMVNNPKMPYKENWTIEQLFEDRGWVWMQFTGLTDRHGVEIYEGDIVNVLGSLINPNIYASEERIEFTGEVYWREDRWFIKNKTDGDYDNGDFYDGDEINWINVEVIGNIYENPSLLQEL